MTATTAAGLSDMTFPTAMTGLQNLEKLGIVAEVTGKDRGRIFAYQRYLDLLGDGTEPICR